MDSFDSFFPDSSTPSSAKTKPGNCGWHGSLTFLSLLLVGGLSFLMAFLTKDVPDRPVWMVGLIFMVPAGAMFLSAMLMEFSQGAMTPSTSRSSQVKVAVAATLATMVIGCACDAVYLYGGYVGDSSDNLLFIIYEPNASGNTSTDRAVMDVLDDLYQRSAGKVETGLFVFDYEKDQNNKVIPLATFTDDQRNKMYRALIEGQQLQYTPYGLEYGYQMAEACENKKPTRIIIISEGLLYYTNEETVDDLLKNHIRLYFMGQGEADEVLKDRVIGSGGQIISGFDATNVLENLRTFTKMDGDMVRSDTASADILTGIMLLLEGLVIGIGLMLLLSLRGQKRFQVILSPVMAGLAFLVLKVIPLDSLDQWIKEGIAFSALGLVFMTRNFAPGRQTVQPAECSAGPAAMPPAPADDEWG